MKLESLHIGMRVRHPQYGPGVVKALNESTAEIHFDTAGRRAVAPEPGGVEPGEPQATITGLEMPLNQLILQSVESFMQRLGIEPPQSSIGKLGSRWKGGRLVLHPVDSAAPAKELPLDTFFHKIVMMRNQLRVLEQKINSHEQLSDAEKVDLQGYITRCYGSMTTFNVLFREKEDQF
jgi:hypothetical protein